MGLLGGPRRTAETIKLKHCRFIYFRILILHKIILLMLSYDLKSSLRHINVMKKHAHG